MRATGESSLTRPSRRMPPVAGSVRANGGAFLPLTVLLAEAVPVLVVQRLQVGPFGGEHRDRQERAADLDEPEPVDVSLAAVLAGDATMSPGRAHRIASRRGTTKITAAGKLTS
jgi:hypothetical protein